MDEAGISKRTKGEYRMVRTETGGVSVSDTIAVLNPTYVEYKDRNGNVKESGWYPCSRETFRHLKQVRRKLAKAYAVYKKLSRIMGKSVPNRSQSEFRKTMLNYDGRLYDHSEKTWEEWMGSNLIPADLRFPIVETEDGDVNLYLYIDAQVQAASIPRASEEDLQPIELPYDWRKIQKSL